MFDSQNWGARVNYKVNDKKGKRLCTKMVVAVLTIVFVGRIVGTFNMVE